MRSGLSESRAFPIILRPMFPLAVVRVAALHVPPGRRDELVEFIHGDYIRRHGKRTADDHPVLRPCEGHGAALGRSRTLFESTRGQHRHGGTRRAVADFRAWIWNCRG